MARETCLPGPAAQLQQNQKRIQCVTIGSLICPVSTGGDPLRRITAVSIKRAL
jgi:hypothetical protein